MGYLLGFFSTDSGFKLLMLRVEYLGATCVCVMWPIFVLNYVHPGLRLSKKVLALLVLVPALTYLQVLTFRFHDFFYRSYGFGWQDGLYLSLKEYGPGFYIWAVFSWLVILGGSAVFVRGTLAMPRPFRSQMLPVVVILVAMLIPNMLYVVGANPFSPYDPTPVSFAVIGVSFMFAMWRSGLFDVLPVAHSLVFRDVATGVLILDGPGRILEINEAAARPLAVEAQRVVGKDWRDVFPILRESIMETPGGYEDETPELQLDDRTYEVTVTPLSDPSAPGPDGRVIMLYDITARKQALERQSLLAAEAQAHVQTLHGLLPICSACKRIRDDSGYWQEVEEYVREHSEAEFTHGMCPACIRKYYAEFSDDEDPAPGSDT